MERFISRAEFEDLPDGSKLGILRMKGYIQLDTVKEMEQQIIDCYERQTHYLILDFAEVQLINSTGLGMMVKVQDLFQSNGREILLMGVDDKIGSLLSMLGISNLFRNVNSKEQAMQILSGSPDAGPLALSREKPELARPAQLSPAKQLMKSLPENDASPVDSQQVPVADTSATSTHTAPTASPSPVLPEKTVRMETIVDNTVAQNEYQSVTRRLTRSIPETTRRKQKTNFAMKIDYYSTMQQQQIYPLKIHLQLEKQTVDALQEVVLTPIFPGCAVAPPQLDVEVTAQQITNIFYITPVVPGNIQAKVRMATFMKKAREIKFPVYCVSGKQSRALGIAALVIATTGIVLDGFQPAQQSVAKLSLLIHFCGSILYPCLGISILCLLVAGYFSRKKSVRTDSCEVSVTL